MQKKWVTRIAILAAICVLGSACAFAAAGDKARVKGMIISRNGESFIVNGENGKTTVVLNDDSKTRDNRGMFGLRKKYMANTVLIPGLKVDVDGIADDHNNVIAKIITVDGDDLETAQMI